MNIILVSNRLTNAVTLGPRALWLAGIGMALTLLAAGIGIGSLFGGTRVQPLWHFSKATRQVDIDALAVKLGELQAKLTRIDGLAQQVGTKTGIDVKPFLSSQPAPRGGLDSRGRAMSASELAGALSQADRQAGAYLDQLTLSQSTLLGNIAWQLPTHAPLAGGLQSSSFGWRIDPFNGHQTFHEGIDFVGETGTAIHAAAAGTVVYAAFHPQYGNMVELDHGNGLTSRYAHASKLLVQEGETIKVGQAVAELGSTGRSTGPHLHFEIRYKGVAQNPLRFITTANVPVLATSQSSD
ncbi:Murein hydrolase activator NlpD [Andreprevotia sp. IGB-42]|uniref:M23 family metallopeptidase n=1 Tax=Andreprevotia sp. IGB-42 TaxID=2497473 RepID=UPI00135BAE74|nr:M23 family metallopeptidase [Andreprevotia sp. IGB-42]KAF0812202.1 Murein hydrolase activator NlpD [Andreprevotia sp. IGB-42]